MSNSTHRRRPDIAFFIPDLGAGGAERVVVLLANAFTNWGYAIDVVLARRRGELLNELDARVTLQSLNVSARPAVVPKLSRYIRQQRPRVVMSHMDIANVAALLASRISGVDCPVIVCSHVVLRQDVEFPQSLRTRALLTTIGLLYKRAAYVVAVSHGVERRLRELANLHGDQTRVIYNPIDVLAIQSRSPRPVRPPKCDTIKFVAVGRLVLQKDYPTLLRALAIASRTHGVSLNIVGAGPLRSELERFAIELGLTGAVRFEGYSDQPYAYMADADVLVLSSAWEGFGNVLVEAMACGTPVVATDCPSGPAEILDDGRYGPLVSVGDAEELAAAMLATAENPISAKVLKARAAEFSVKRAAASYLILAQPFLE